MGFKNCSQNHKNLIRHKKNLYSKYLEYVDPIFCSNLPFSYYGPETMIDESKNEPSTGVICSIRCNWNSFNFKPNCYFHKTRNERIFIAKNRRFIRFQ